MAELSEEEREARGGGRSSGSARSGERAAEPDAQSPAGSAQELFATGLTGAGEAAVPGWGLHVRGVVPRGGASLRGGAYGGGRASRARGTGWGSPYAPRSSDGQGLQGLYLPGQGLSTGWASQVPLVMTAPRQWPTSSLALATGPSQTACSRRACWAVLPRPSKGTSPSGAPDTSLFLTPPSVVRSEEGVVWGTASSSWAWDLGMFL